MDPTHFLALVLSCQMLSCQSIAWDAQSLSSPVITRNHHRLNGFAFISFYFVSQVSCDLQCQRHPRCVSTNFRKVSSLNETETRGVCELNEQGAESPIAENEELEYDKETVYTQFRDMKHDCQLTGCLNGGSCTFNEALKAFTCKCEGAWSGQYCHFVCPVPLGMESGAILDSQISASSEYSIYHLAHQARLHFKALDGKAGCWSSTRADYKPWLQVDLQNVMRVTQIATQGRNAYGVYKEWVTKYKLQYSKDGQTFRIYRRNGDNADTVFMGNTDRDTVVYHQLNPIIKARYVLVLPVEWHNHISMRMELYTC